MGKWRKASTTCIVEGTDILNAEIEWCFVVCQSGDETRRTSDSRRVVRKIVRTRNKISSFDVLLTCTRRPPIGVMIPEAV